MNGYENEYSNFPEQMITIHNYKNVDDDIAPIINEINSLRSRGLYGQAAKVIEKNAAALSSYNIDAAAINTIVEEIYNTQKFAKKIQQCIYLEADEPEAYFNDVWIGGTE